MIFADVTLGTPGHSRDRTSPPRAYLCFTGRCFRASAPFFTRFSAHCCARRVLTLDPMRRGARRISAVPVLRDDAFEPHFAGVLEDEFTVGFDDVLAQPDAGRMLAQQAR